MSDEDRLQLEQECLLKYSKAQMIEKYIDELEENIKLSDLWCKSQQENKQLKSILIELEEYIKKHIEEWENDEDEYMNGVVAEDKDILQLIQELKEKYK